jgi:hypothetical protein
MGPWQEPRHVLPARPVRRHDGRGPRSAGARPSHLGQRRARPGLQHIRDALRGGGAGRVLLDVVHPRAWRRPADRHAMGLRGVDGTSALTRRRRPARKRHRRHRSAAQPGRRPPPATSLAELRCAVHSSAPAAAPRDRRSAADAERRGREELFASSASDCRGSRFRTTWRPSMPARARPRRRTRLHMHELFECWVDDADGDVVVVSSPGPTGPATSPIFGCS